MHERFLRIDEALNRLEPLIVSTLLSPRAAEQFAAGAISHGELKPYVTHLRRLSEDYVSERRYAIPPIGNDEAVTAYALYFLPINFAKILYLLEELPAGFGSKPLSILDFGCGPGTGALAAREHFGSGASIHLADHSVAMLSAAKVLFKSAFPDDSAPTSQSPFETLNSEQVYDLVIAANVLTEIPERPRKELAAKLLSKVAPGGALMILEPALLEPTRAAMRMRDEMLAENPDLMPIFPCTRRDECPMVRKDPANWCHGTLRWESSRLVSQLDELSGFNKHRLKFSAFIFQRGGVMKRGIRVLREAERKKYGQEVMLCGPSIYGDAVIKKSAPEELRKEIARADQFALVDEAIAALAGPDNLDNA